MSIPHRKQIDQTLTHLYKDAKYDYLKMMKGVAKTIFRPMQPSDFKEAYLSISREQGEDLIQLITQNNFKNIVEFGTSFGISTLFLAKGVVETGGHIITTELIPSKAKTAVQNFEQAGVAGYIEVKVGDALKTLNNHQESIDLLLLDGWKDLYLPMFKMLEPNFHSKTIIYVDNADMLDTQAFLRTVRKKDNYELESKHDGKVVLITLKNMAL